MDLFVTKCWTAGLFICFVICELSTGRFVFRTLTRKKDVIIDVLSNGIVPILIAPTVLFASNRLIHYLLPQSKDVLASIQPLVMFGILLLADDLTQYFWHRLSHSSWLYPLHRAHHSAHYLSVRVVYRNNLIYYMLMPGLWLSGALIYCGLWAVYPIYGIIKMTVIITAHSSVPWDAPLYAHPYTKRLMWIIERVISTPSTHSMHHGLHEADGITHYKGNYGNLLFIWDIIFGTARITRKRPSQFGIEGLEEIGWVSEVVCPTPVRHLAITPQASAKVPIDCKVK
jgi:sterol desaturase/sphingolipid hydroxylase (fatty acid hydroxylase superfamily)